jgi:hypothetical protein
MVRSVPLENFVVEAISGDFHEVSYHSGRKYERNGTARRQTDGNWHFDDQHTPST